MGRRHTATALALGHMVAVCDPAQRPPENIDAQWTQDLAQGYRWKPDAVVLATPASTHADLLWGQKKPIQMFVEKPVALSMADFWRPSYGAVPLANLAVGYQFRFHPHVRKLRAWVKARPEPPRAAIFWCASDARTWPGSGYADALLEASHEIDLAQYLFGSMVCCGAFQQGETWELLLLAGQTRVTIHLSTDSARYERWAAILPGDGTTAWWGWRAPLGESSLDLPGSDSERLFGVGEDIYRAELTAFLSGRWAAEGGCSLGEAKQVLAVCDRARSLAGTDV